MTVYLDQRISSYTPSSVVRNWDYFSVNRGNLNHHQLEVITSSDYSSCKCYIVPPYLQQQIITMRENSEQEHIRGLAAVHRYHQALDNQFRQRRKENHSSHREWLHKHKEEEEADSQLLNLTPTQIKQLEAQVRSVHDVYHSDSEKNLPGKFITSETGKEGIPGFKKNGSTEDPTAVKALENALNVFLFYLKKYDYDSIDGHGKPIDSVIHFGQSYNNAFYDGQRMVYGDGDRQLFQAFVDYLDVVGHEMTHGVTGDRLDYQGQAGALNEHFSDVMGLLVLMHTKQLNPSTASWLLADGILTYKGKEFPLRSFKSPGTAYDIPELGKDPQPAKYGDLFKGKEDNGGVHINSGIPNHAFYLFTTRIHEAGIPWELAGFIWFITMMTPDAFKPNATMKEFAEATIKTAETLEITRNNTKLLNTLRGAWTEVEVL